MDNQDIRPVTPWWFWLVGALFIIWNLFGVYNYLASTSATVESLMAQNYTREQADFMMEMPAYYMAVFALAVWSGILASILLVLRKSLAVPVFIFSAAMAILSFILDAVGGSFKMLGTPYVVIMGVVVVLAAVEVLFARKMRARGILR